MLLSWRDEVRAALSPDRVALARISRRGQPRILAKEVTHHAVSSPADWGPSLHALEQRLKEPSWANADATVIVSNHFVRYAVVPWSEHLVSDDEKRAWVAHHFSERYGEPSRPREFRWSEQGSDAPCVATAVDQDLITGIRGVFDQTALRLRSIQPFLMAVFNRCKRRLKRGAAWLVLPESGRLCIASVAHGRWQRITSRNIPSLAENDLAVELERQLVLADDMAPAAIFAYTSDLPELRRALGNDVPLTVLGPRRLRGYTLPEDSEYAIAVAGVA